jgi:drug/metabolite transporter (DMT)-like permease
MKNRAIAEALLVTFLWSTSWVLIKEGLQDIPPLLFAGLRYVLAFLFLLPLVLRKSIRKEIKSLTQADWRWLAVLGLFYYTLAQGAQFLGLSYLPANMLSLLLTLSVITIAFGGKIFLGERLSAIQWIGVGISIGGALIYFGRTPVLSQTGLLVGLFAMLSISGGALLARQVNRSGRISASVVTLVSMGFGSILLLGLGLAFESLPRLGGKEWLIILWLAAVNTAFAFTLWNRSLQHLSAAQSGAINNTMLIQIAILAWIFLGERLSAIQIFGLSIALIGTVLVQRSPGQRSKDS